MTDPPFFDSVHYSELADFFFAWQQLASDRRQDRNGTTRSPSEVQDSDGPFLRDGLIWRQLAKHTSQALRMPLTSAEKELAAAIGFDDDVCEIVKENAGRTFHRLTAYTAAYVQKETDGLSVEVGRQDVEPLIALLQPQLSPRGYRAFWSETYKSNGAKKSDELAVLKTTDDYSIISIRRSNGGNYGVTMDDVINKLKGWENRCQFHIVGAGGTWVAIQFESLPESICAFAEEIYDFCPDTVDQGVGLMNERDHPAAFAAARRLCPKLSAEMQQKLDEKKARFEQMELPPQFRELRDQILKSSAGGFTTPTDMGIRLLAYHLKQSRQLFLWWD